MITVISHLESLPQPYRGEAMLYRDSKADNMFTCTLGAALMLALPRGIIRDTILKAWNRGEFAAKHVGQPEARVDMAMPELAGGIFRFDDCEGYTDTNSDQYETY